MPIQPRAEFQAFLGAFPGFDFPSPEAVVATRAAIASMPPPPMPDSSKVSMSSETIPAEGSESEMRLLWARPVSGSSSGTVIVFHGGGFVVGAPEMDIPLLGYFADVGNLNVISVDYRLAPEHVYPAAYDDAERAWTYLTSSAGAAKFGVDLGRIALYGSSAGSALAAGLARRVHKTGGLQPKIIACDSTLADDRLIYPSSTENHEDGPNHIWSRKNIIQSRTLAFEDKDATIEVAPLRSTDKNDFKGLPPHYIASCEIDALGEQGPAFAKKLQEAGVAVELHVWSRAPHAFSSLQPESKLSQLLYAELVRVISDAFEGA